MASPRLEFARGSKHHLICDGRGTPLKVIITAANVNNVTQTLAPVDGVPPVAGRPGRPRRRPEALLGDKGYDSKPNRDELRKRRILPVISRKGSPNVKGLGKLRYVVEQTFALLHQFKRLAVRRERRTELHNAFASLACSLICWRRLKKTSHDRAAALETAATCDNPSRVAGALALVQGSSARRTVQNVRPRRVHRT
ncbi:transposase [Streptomyces althioticus]